jgi:hypothetical protein
MRVVDEPVEDGVSNRWLPKGVVPFAHRQLAGDHRGAQLVAVFDDLEVIPGQNKDVLAWFGYQWERRPASGKGASKNGRRLTSSRRFQAPDCRLDLGRVVCQLRDSCPHLSPSRRDRGV